MRSALLSTLSLLFLAQCAATPSATQAAATPPKAVLMLAEVPHRAFYDGPWPSIMRFIAYDSGLVIRQPVRGDGAQPALVWQQRTPAEVMAWVAEIGAAALADVEVTTEPSGIGPYDGVTFLEYWDSASDSQGLTRLRTFGMPCAATDSDAREERVAVARQSTNPRFLAFCDSLMRQPLAGAEVWHPAEMVVSLLVADDLHPQEVVPWPDDWPKKFQTFDHGGYRMIDVCVPVGATPHPVTARILDRTFVTQRPSIAVNRVGAEWWEISRAEVALPGEVLSWFRGPCSTDPRFQSAASP